MAIACTLVDITPNDSPVEGMHALFALLLEFKTLAGAAPSRQLQSLSLGEP